MAGQRKSASPTRPTSGGSHLSPQLYLLRLKITLFPYRSWIRSLIMLSQITITILLAVKLFEWMFGYNSCWNYRLFKFCVTRTAHLTGCFARVCITGERMESLFLWVAFADVLLVWLNILLS
ncbi:hypothetical protein F5884DRAFT_781698, partial [Xylogone sp. PMI_703]